ncbi:MAG: hypothetical protein ACREMA_03075, partial [Longimicrobiales bacterium]
MRRVRNLTLISAFVLALPVAAQTAAPPASGRAATPGITAADVFARISFLASDELKGRDTPSPGLELAASYIAQEFKSFGLQPGGDSSTFIQRWPFENSRITAEGARVVLGTGARAKSLTYAQEFFIIPGPVDSVSGALMYAGTAATGATAPPPSARGQILAYYVPGKSAEDPAWLQGVQGTLPAAISAQPQAVVLLLDPEFGAEQIGFIATNAAGDQLPVTLLGIRYDAAKAWFAQAGADLDALRARKTPDAAPNAAVTLSMV